jgi:hypothetical protein
MCIKYIYNLCFKSDEYEDIIELQEQNAFDECMNILNMNEPGLVIRYTSETGFITFSKLWVNWINNASKHLKEFITPYNQIEVQKDLIQLIYFCKIPVKYHKTFLALLEAEY